MQGRKQNIAWGMLKSKRKKQKGVEKRFISSELAVFGRVYTVSQAFKGLFIIVFLMSWNVIFSLCYTL